MVNSETKTFSLCDECVTVKTTVKDIISSVINTNVTRHEAIMSIYEMLSKFISNEDRNLIMKQIEELI